MKQDHRESGSTSEAVSGVVQRDGKLDLRPATPVPAMTLPSTRDRDVELNRIARNHHLVLFCYPGDREGLHFPELTGCTPEACSFHDQTAPSPMPEQPYSASARSPPRAKRSSWNARSVRWNCLAIATKSLHASSDFPYGNHLRGSVSSSASRWYSTRAMDLSITSANRHPKSMHDAHWRKFKT